VYGLGAWGEAVVGAFAAPGGENGPKPPGGATPTIVPLKACRAGAAGAAGPGGGAAAGGGATGGGGTEADFAAPGWFIMSIVPLNFGAAAPLMLNPHLVQVVAVSGFFVPQFGQNKCASEGRGFAPLAMPTDAPLYATRKPAWFSSFACAGHPREHRSTDARVAIRSASTRQSVGAFGCRQILLRWRRITALTPRPSAH